MTVYTFEEIARIVKGKVLQEGTRVPIEYLLQDSRRIIHPDTSLFFALPTGRRDGHAYIEDAYKAGVRHFVVSRIISMEGLEEAGVLWVPDTLRAMGQLAAWHRSRFNLPVIGITGSNGKTIVKEWLYQLLQGTYRIVRSPRSYNSQIGVPLSVWQIQGNDTLGIFEAGISLPGEMAFLEPLIRPEYGILTNLGAAHDEGFPDRRQKLREKLRLFRESRWLIFCQDDPLVRQEVGHFKEDHPSLELFAWSRPGTDAEGAALRLLEIRVGKGESFLVARYGGQDQHIRIPFTDDASIENAVHCWCQLLLLDYPVEGIRSSMGGLQPVAMRLELKAAIHQCTLINDSYNADLDALIIALDFLGQQQQHARKTVILSDLLETGQSDEDVFTAVALALEQKKIDRLIGIGEHIQQYAPLFDHLPEKIFFPNTTAFIDQFPSLVFRDESILLKGARAFAFERISRLLELQAHQTLLEIDLDAMAYNLQVYRDLLRPSTRIMAMVKAFSYGSGSYEIANLLQFKKVDYLAVAYADEGVHLRTSGITLPIMVMNPETTSFDMLIQQRLEPELFSFALLHTFRTYLEGEGIQRYPVHIKLDTGIHRLGFAPSEVAGLAELLRADNTLEIKSVFSHLAAGEDPEEDAFTLKQAALFQEGCALLQGVIPYPFLRHLDNTAGVLRHPDLQFDMVRLGIGLYGVSSAPNPMVSLREVSTLKTTIAQVRSLEPGDTVGYNRKGIITQPSVIATVRIGYADGYPRVLGNGTGKMMIQGKQVPTIGSVSMDMTMLDITGLQGVEEGDEVVVFGGGLPVQQVARWAGTIPYDILTGISQRVKRVYFEQ